MISGPRNIRSCIVGLDGEHGNAEENGHGEEEEMIVISREMVELVAKERNVKKMCMDLAHVLL